MGLQIKHNRAEHTHENEQFRRIAKSLKLLFNEKNWDGLLIGNPYNEKYYRFRPDGILIYNNGLIIIDLKAYTGNVKLPPSKSEFESTAWYVESETDKKRTMIKAGSSFINPFRQLNFYRGAFKEIVKNELGLKGLVDEHRTCALNIFSGPLTVQNSVPKEIPYYKITQESDLGNMLYDYSGVIKFNDELVSTLIRVFNAEEWQEHVQMPESKAINEHHTEIDANIESKISEFLKTKSSGVLILESMEFKDRDDWVKHILSEAQSPDVFTWIHSARIGRKVKERMGFKPHSLYNTIYGGASKTEKDSALESQNVEQLPKDKQIEEKAQEIIPIGSDDWLDKAAVIILHEAHLVSRSLHQSELLRFGTGRLLEDLLTFLNQEENERKLICIGDPYSLSFGKDTDSAINPENYKVEISHYIKPLISDEFNGKLGLRLGVAYGIENKKFNNLIYPWKTDNLNEITNAEIPNYLNSWYSEPINSEPSKTVMVYANKDARKINLWIKKNVIKNGKDLAAGDLLILSNNINIPDETGFNHPTKLYNGMFLLVNSIEEMISKPLPIEQSKKPIILNFREVQVTCLSLPNRLKTNLYILDNYFASDDGLSKEEQIAFRVFVNKLLKEKEEKNPFDESSQYSNMKQDKNYQEALESLADLKKRDDAGERVKKKLNAQEVKIRKIERKYKQEFRKRLLLNITQNNPLVNAGHVNHGWALTVHKCIGSSFSQAIINTYRGENRGIKNAEYYRWLYSGVTTTTNKLLVVNPQFIHPLMDTIFEDTSTVEAPKRKPLTFPDYKIEKRFDDKIPAELKKNVKGAVRELSIKLEQHGLLLESINPIGDYLTKAIYSAPSENEIIVLIDNKGPRDYWSVSSIRIEPSSSEFRNIINQEIESLFTHIVSAEFPSDFREPIYQNWNSILNNIGYQLSLTESYANQDVFFISGTRNESARIRVWYTNKGFFTKIVVLQKSSNEIGYNLQKWLLNGNKA